MELQLNEIERALDAGLYLIALQASLALPDICAALQSENGVASPEKYIAWYDTYAKEPDSPALSGQDCYRFRCSYLHQGSTIHPKSSYSRIMFIIPNERFVIKNCVFNDALCIDVVSFCNNIIRAVRNWETIVCESDNFKKNYGSLLRIYPNGLSPYIGNIPVIS